MRHHSRAEEGTTAAERQLVIDRADEAVLLIEARGTIASAKIGDRLGITRCAAT